MTRPEPNPPNQDLQNNFMRKVPTVSQSGRMIESDGQMLSLKYKIIERKLRVIGKT